MFYVHFLEESEDNLRKVHDMRVGKSPFKDTATPERSYSMPRIDHFFCVGYGAGGFRGHYKNDSVHTSSYKRRFDNRFPRLRDSSSDL